MLWTDKVKKILLTYFNGIELKDKQIDIINEILTGNDVVGLLPTGYGKSMCYIIPPLITKKTIFIISPLISLMEDQKDNLSKKNITVATLHCNNKNKQTEIFKIIDGTIKIVYMSPEFLVEGDGMELAASLIEKNMLGYLAIDESHCISSWGHNFRPNYLKLNNFRHDFPQIPILALTATAKKVVIEEIVKLLDLQNPSIISTSFDRPNLHIICKEIPKEPKYTASGNIMRKKGEPVLKNVEKWVVIQDYINKYPDNKIIIYVNSRNETEQVAIDINNNLYQCAVAYHAGLNKDLREKVQNDFNENKIKVIISTIAFGMGIDQIVRCVLIFGCPSSIEEYYQQIGRGGRDGLYCETVLFFDKSGFMRSKSMIEKETPNEKLRQFKKDNIQKVYDFYNMSGCRRTFILNYFGQKASKTCTNCDNCLRVKKPITPPKISNQEVDPFDKIDILCKKIRY